jgi:hypothetical protein
VVVGRRFGSVSAKQLRGGVALVYGQRFLAAAAEFGFREHLQHYMSEVGDCRYSINPYMLRHGGFEYPLLDVSCGVFSKTWYRALSQLDLPDYGHNQLGFLLSHISGRRDGWLLEREDDVERLTDEIIGAFKSNAMPLFRSFTTVDEVLAMVEQGRYLPRGQRYALEQAAKYREAIGEQSEFS